LAGQRLEYMTRALRAYAVGRRFSGVMRPIAAGLSPEARDTALRYYAGLPREATAGDRQSEQVRRGEEIARRGVPAHDIPSCAKCHLSTRVNEAYPRLAGQDREYLVLQLELLQAGRRGGSEFVHLMDEFVGYLTRRQIEDVAAYFASLE
jgi:cytochrome c553